MAAWFAILGVLIGSFATLYLFKSICLRLDESILQKISIAFLVSAVFSILTFVAAAMDICDDDLYGNVGCDKIVHLAAGGVAEIFAMFFFLAAAAATFQLSRVAETTQGPDASDTEVLPLHNKDPPPPPPSSNLSGVAEGQSLDNA
jgi:hypothetical protein